MKVAVVGSGIAGLAAAHTLRNHAEVTVFEAGSHFGGHANTVDLTLDGITAGVDTGFLVFNERTYPRLIRLFADLQVPTARSEMSFSVQVPGAAGSKPLEWSGTNLRSLFCQPVNMVRPGFWRMLRDLRRFNRLGTQMATTGSIDMHQPVGDFLKAQGFSNEFRDWYLLPMIACIWSSPADGMLRFPIGTLVNFCHNHGLLQIEGRPQWHTVQGGSRVYVRRIVAGLKDARLNTPVQRIRREKDSVWVTTDQGTERFDQLVMATHPDQALSILDADAQERAVLGAIRYQPNVAVLHTDASVLPRNQLAWAAWNYESAPASEGGSVCLHYLINRLQPLPWQRPVVVTLNPLREIRSDQVAARIEYAHPVFDARAVNAQKHLAGLQGRRRTWLCGAWTGYGFHEDGLRSGQEAGQALRALALRAQGRVGEALEAVT